MLEKSFNVGYCGIILFVGIYRDYFIVNDGTMHFWNIEKSFKEFTVEDFIFARRIC
jgi:hypothetical protein